MRAPTGKRIQVERQRGNERLAFTRRHFRDAPKVQLDPADELHVVRHHVPRHLTTRNEHRRALQSAACFTHCRKRLGEQLVEHLREHFAEFAFNAAATVGTLQLGFD